MNEALIVMSIVNGLISTAKNAYDAYIQINGSEGIPTWDEIISGNAKLQEKIDQEGN